MKKLLIALTVVIMAGCSTYGGDFSGANGGYTSDADMTYRGGD